MLNKYIVLSYMYKMFLVRYCRNGTFYTQASYYGRETDYWLIETIPLMLYQCNLNKYILYDKLCTAIEKFYTPR